jgi:protein arginine kinase activator
MLCQECRRNEANIHIVKNIAGKQSELNLCEQCARKKEELDFSFEPQFSLHKLFASMLEQSLQGSRKQAGDPNLQCSSCGLSFAQFSQIGRLGCSECFTAFNDRLKPLLRRIHGGCSHSGKVPSRLRNKVNLLREIDQLKTELQEKVQNEEFEEAALLRDRIREMEGNIKKNDHNDHNEGESQ